MPPAPAPSEEPPVADEEEDELWHYRVLCFMQIGFDHWQSVQLADHGADWHRAMVMLEHGCRPSVALRILL